jgi:hypothetical protein
MATPCPVEPAVNVEQLHAVLVQLQYHQVDLRKRHIAYCMS